MFLRFFRFASRLVVVTLRTHRTVVLTRTIRRKLKNSTELSMLNVMAHLKNVEIDLFRKEGNNTCQKSCYLIGQHKSLW